MKAKPDIGKISCKRGGNHHLWVMGACLDCNLPRRKFMEQFRERQRQRTKSLRGSTSVGKGDVKI